MIQYRFDKAERVNAYLDEAGFLRAKVRLTKPGVYSYLKPDGSISKEAKLPEEVFSKDFLRSLDGLPITDGHPYEHGGLVNASNYKSLVKGVITNPRVEDGFVVADEVIFDPELIQSVLKGEKLEVSLGLKTEIGLGGTLGGVTYDVAQRKMIGNHLAHVSKGRVEGAQILLDSKDYAIQGGAIMAENVNETQEPGWVKKIVDGFEKLFSLFESAFASKEEKPKEEQKAKEETQTQTEKPKEETQTQKEKPKEDNNALKQEIANLKTVINTLSANLNTKMDEAIQREVLIDTVKAVLPNMNVKGLSNLEIKKEFIKSQIPDVRLDSNELVDVYFQASLKLAQEKAKLNPSTKTEVKTDSMDIESLKTKRLNLYKEVK